MALGALAVVGWEDRPKAPRLRLDGSAVDTPAGLESALGAALGLTLAAIAFPCGHGEFIDARGMPCSPSTGATPVIDALGVTVAMVTPRLVHDPALAEDVVAVLRVAGQGALLRSRLRQQAQTLGESHDRLLRAGEVERARLVAELARGPLGRMDAVAAELSRCRPPALSRQALTVREGLMDMARGIDPVAGASLDGALRVLATTSRTQAVLDIVLPAGWTPSASVATAAWFTCAEGLANATKHAPGATVRVSASLDDATLRVGVSDDGPGGADAHGSGLRGLAERIESVGGTLDVKGGVPGSSSWRRSWWAPWASASRWARCRRPRWPA